MGEGAPVSQLERARLDIAHLRLDEHDDLWRAVDSALRVSARTLGVARVGVWFMSGDSLYRARVHGAEDARREDVVLPLGKWPEYVEAIASRRVIAADDVRTDPRTAALVPGYCEPLGITSMLDAPLFLTGEIRGIVCHEHIGPPRSWTQREIDFATSVADMLGALFEQSMRLSAERGLRAMEASTARARELTLAARATAGVAHDVNTVLQAIMNSAGGILEDCRRSARLLDELRELEHTPVRVQESIALGEVVEALEPTLRALAGDHRLTVSVDKSAWTVAATRTDIERIVLNLVTNASEVSARGAAVAVSVRREGDSVVLAVKDEGPGIDESLVDRVFEPYYSTKRDSRGGLGLFIVEVLSRRSGGVAGVKSDAGRGTTFTVTWTAP